MIDDSFMIWSTCQQLFAGQTCPIASSVWTVLHTKSQFGFEKTTPEMNSDPGRLRPVPNRVAVARGRPRLGGSQAQWIEGHCIAGILQAEVGGLGWASGMLFLFFQKVFVM